jgi:CRP/FNR family transcriptional regulator
MNETPMTDHEVNLIASDTPLFDGHSMKVACSNCNLRELCMPVGLSPQELIRIDEVVAVRRKVKRGTTLFRNGESFQSLFAIRTGFFKTCVTAEDGRDQVTGFHRQRPPHLRCCRAGRRRGLRHAIRPHRRALA